MLGVSALQRAALVMSLPPACRGPGLLGAGSGPQAPGMMTGVLQLCCSSASVSLWGPSAGAASPRRLFSTSWSAGCRGEPDRRGGCWVPLAGPSRSLLPPATHLDRLPWTNPRHRLVGEKRDSGLCKHRGMKPMNTSRTLKIL